MKFKIVKITPEYSQPDYCPLEVDEDGITGYTVTFACESNPYCEDFEKTFYKCYYLDLCKMFEEAALKPENLPENFRYIDNITFSTMEFPEPMAKIVNGKIELDYAGHPKIYKSLYVPGMKIGELWEMGWDPETVFYEIMDKMFIPLSKITQQ